MALDPSAFRRAVAQLASGLAAARAAPDDELMRDGVIQRFEDTYELSHKSPRRFLEETEPAPDQLRELSFPALIRLGAERGSAGQRLGRLDGPSEGAGDHQTRP